MPDPVGEYIVGYKPNVISTIVDSSSGATSPLGYKPNVISTIVDISKSLYYDKKAISQM